MHWLLTVSVVIVLLVLSFILFIFMPKTKVFFDTCDESVIFVQNHDELKASIGNLGNKWAIIPIYINGRIINDKYPFLYELLQCLPNVICAGIMVIGPKCSQPKQYGYDKINDKTLRHFYCIKQSAAQKSGIWIDGERKFFSEKEWICGDMSRENSLFNKNKKQSSIVIFVDIDRPNNIPIGCSRNNSIRDDAILKKFKSA